MGGYVLVIDGIDFLVSKDFHLLPTPNQII